MLSRYYKNLLSTAKTNLTNYKKRKSQLEAIRDDYSMFDGYATDLNNCCTLASTNSRLGIVISGGSNDVGSVFGRKDGGTADDYLSSSKEYIKAEIRRVNSKIEELERDIRSYNTKIKQEEEREEDEREKQNC